MRSKMTILELWKAVHACDERYRTRSDHARSTGKEQPFKEQTFSLDVADSDGNIYAARVLRAKCAVEQTLRVIHATSQPVKRRTETSRRIAGGLIMSTVGGTVHFDMSGNAMVHVTGADGEQRTLQLSIPNRPTVEIAPAGEITLERVSDSELGWAARHAAKADPALREQLQRLLDAQRHLL